jgi:hypothetical protein
MGALLRYIAPLFTAKTGGPPDMARAFVGNIECKVTVDKDLGDTWAVAVVPPPPKSGERPLPLRVLKLQGEDREKAMKGALEIMQQQGQIDRFEL